jgi:hypothetical protein
MRLSAFGSQESSNVEREVDNFFENSDVVIAGGIGEERMQLLDKSMVLG